MRTLLLFFLCLTWLCSTRLAVADAVLDGWKPSHSDWVTDPDPAGANPDECGQADAITYFREHPKTNGSWNKFFDIGMGYALKIGFRGQRSHSYAYEFANTLKVCVTQGVSDGD